MHHLATIYDIRSLIMFLLAW